VLDLGGLQGDLDELIPDCEFEGHPVAQVVHAKEGDGSEQWHVLQIDVLGCGILRCAAAVHGLGAQNGLAVGLHGQGLVLAPEIVCDDVGHAGYWIQPAGDDCGHVG